MRAAAAHRATLEPQRRRSRPLDVRLTQQARKVRTLRRLELFHELSTFPIAHDARTRSSNARSRSNARQYASGVRRCVAGTQYDQKEGLRSEWNAVRWM